MDLKEIKSIIDLMTKNGLSEFELEKQEAKIRIKRGFFGENTVSTVSPSYPPISAPGPQTMVIPLVSSAAERTSAAPPISTTKTILSPMVGTFYPAPSPDSAPYVQIGQEVNEEMVVCIIEAMKVMNEIKAEMKGIVTEVLAETGKPVDYNRPLFRLKPLA
jgi:acetyl-CoA carboxylase biotin carboxyl carrier protein